jgi:hypothetical protein
VVGRRRSNVSIFGHRTPGVRRPLYPTSPHHGSQLFTAEAYSLSGTLERWASRASHSIRSRI